TAMLTGFLGVPFYKFLAPKLGSVGFIFDKMGELPPAFATAFLAAVVVSLLDKQGQRELEGVAEDLKAAAK
ncbi:MAG: hypothetical protein VX278_19875, partial [Myxococcota bacterium]|nr:hypothetical protein [Myxococcota bacterium]